MDFAPRAAAATASKRTAGLQRRRAAAAVGLLQRARDLAENARSFSVTLNKTSCKMNANFVQTLMCVVP